MDVELEQIGMRASVAVAAASVAPAVSTRATGLPVSGRLAVSGSTVAPTVVPGPRATGRAQGNVLSTERLEKKLISDMLALQAPASRAKLLFSHLAFFLLTVLNYFLFPCSAFVLAVVRCERDPGTGREYMVNLPNYDCGYIALWLKLVAVAVFILLPLIAMIVGMLVAHERSYVFHVIFSFWFNGYKSSRRLFALVFLLRRLAFSVIVSFLPTSNLYRHLLVIGLLLLSVLVVFDKKPFFFHRVNYIEIVLQAALILIYVIALVLSETQTSTSEAAAASGFYIIAAAAGGIVLWNVAMPIYRVYVLDIWHDEPSRVSAVKRVTRAYTLWTEQGVSPLHMDG